MSHFVEDQNKGGREEPEGGSEGELAEERQEDGILVAHGMTSWECLEDTQWIHKKLHQSSYPGNDSTQPFTLTQIH